MRRESFPSENFHGVFVFAPRTMSDINSQRLAAVNPLLRAKVEKLIAVAAGEGHTLRVSQGLRTWAEQDALYNQPHDHKDNDGDHRVDESDEHVTNARAGESWHNFGMAVDFVFIISGKPSWDDHLYTNIGRWASLVGLDWGGNWKKTKDRPHVQLPNLANKPGADWIAAYKKGGIERAWQLYA